MQLWLQGVAQVMDIRRFTVRWKDTPGSLIAVTSRDGEVEIQEICATCEKRGIIWHVHDESEPHKGSSHFKPYAGTINAR